MKGVRIEPMPFVSLSSHFLRTCARYPSWDETKKTLLSRIRSLRFLVFLLELYASCVFQLPFNPGLRIPRNSKFEQIWPLRSIRGVYMRTAPVSEYSCCSQIALSGKCSIRGFGISQRSNIPLESLKLRL